MRHTSLAIAALLFALTCTGVAVADEKAEQAVPFKPFELVGNWQFTNTDTGVRYDGDIKVAVGSIDTNGAMRGRISYDGRQSNDNCTTKQLFDDTPVDVEVVKANNDYLINFQLKCSRGESPRLFSWTLVCENAVCIQRTVRPHGKGAITLKENR